MASRRISDFRFQIPDFVCGCAAALVVLIVASAALAETYAERVERVATLSPEEKAALLRKKEQFDKLSAEEQQRLRKLHESLTSAPDAEQLQTVLKRYSTWLRSLQPPGRRAEVLDLPRNQRIARIKEIVHQQEGERFREFVNASLPDEDLKIIYEWLDKFVSEHEEEILDAVRDDRDRRDIRRMDDERARRRRLIIQLGSRWFNRRMPFPSKDEIHAMAAGLSEMTRNEIERFPDEKTRQDRETQLVYGAIWSIAWPPASREELLKYHAELPPERRADLEHLEGEELLQKLRRMHRMDKFRTRGGGFRGPRSGTHGIPGSSAPDVNRQPPGFANPESKQD